MKTSNKILIGLLILIIAIPLIVTQVFKYKIAHGQSTADAIEPTKETPQIVKEGDLTDYKAIKIIDIGNLQYTDNKDMFTFTIKYHAQAKYEFSTKDSSDSFQIRKNGDTLIFQYRSKLAKDRQYRPNHMKLTISLPEWVPIIVDKSRFLLGMQLNTPLVNNIKSRASISMENHALLQLGSDIHLMGKGNAKSSSTNVAFSKDTSDTQRQKSHFMPANLQIQVNNSRVDFQNHLAFTDLTLNMSAGSSLFIHDGFTAKKLSGQINPDVKIESDAIALPILAPLIH